MITIKMGPTDTVKERRRVARSFALTAGRKSPSNLLDG